MRAREVDSAPSPVWEPTAATAVPSAAPQLDPAVVASLIELFSQPAPLAPTHAIAADLKEAEIRAYLAGLTPVQALLTRRRLERTVEDDLVRSFQRLPMVRRSRLLAFLGDARRRHAIRR